MSKIKISIIVPIYNASSFLEKCVRSIMNQNFQDIEIICINDGSVDNSLEILKKLQKEDNRIIIVDKENEGVSKARNIAIEKAKGKYCLNIDSDDWIEQGYLKSMYERAEKDNLDITISNVRFDYLDKPQKNYILNDLNISDVEIITGERYINIFIKENFHGYTCNKLIKTELYKKNNLKYREKITILEDTEVILQLAYYSLKIGKINKAFYHYIQHSSNTKINFNSKKILDMNSVFNYLINFYEKKNINLVGLKLLKSKKMILGCKYLSDNSDFINIVNEVLNTILELKWKDIFVGMKIKREEFYLFILKLFPKKYILIFLIKLDKNLRNLLVRGKK